MKYLSCQEKPCKKCGCNFPNIPNYGKNCGACESPNQMFKRMANKLKILDLEGKNELRK